MRRGVGIAVLAVAAVSTGRAVAKGRPRPVLGAVVVLGRVADFGADRVSHELVWATYAERAKAARDWLAAHPPQRVGDVTADNVAAASLTLIPAKRALQELDAAVGPTTIFRDSGAKARGQVWRVEFPNLLRGGYVTYVEASEGTVLAVVELQEG